MHPDQSKIRRAVTVLDELWRRSGGTLAAISPESVRTLIRGQLDAVEGWEQFMRTRVTIDPSALVDTVTRERLDALPGHLRLRGDAAPLDYEIENGEGIARVRLREGQAKRLQLAELPALDRPLRFAVHRGGRPPVLADSIPQLHAELRRPTRKDGGEGRPHPRSRRSR